jgi:hypothetical protein
MDGNGKQNAITIVSGLPRSGTSMMMMMLEAGGLEPLTDNLRTADEDNPRGYYEFERVKQLKSDKTWLSQAHGKVVKVVSALLSHLPSDHCYKVLFMRRDIDEVLSSQHQMLLRRGKPADRGNDGRMATLFEKHLVDIEKKIADSPCFEVLYVRYCDVLEDPTDWIARINEFLGGRLDEQRMAAVVEQSLHRQCAEH